ncbi:MAG TPA: cytochrome c biogenesis protein DipZ [Patescibacteria group bacterium]|nr:cytochrome c biogenesis protein DipZ [Patescibacteria group bacterium]
MILLVLFSFIAGVVTILSPCILPILPIILTSTIDGQENGKTRPIGIIIGFIASFTFFTLFLTTLVKIIGISADSLRFFSIAVIFFFGLSLLIPKFQTLVEMLFAKLSRFVPHGQIKPGFLPGFLIGISLGLLWTPCVGPILASVISLALTEQVTLNAFLITLAYAIGTAIPMFLIMIGGRNLIRRVPWLLENTAKIQRVFGIIMILTAIGIYLNLDRKFQNYILGKFPNYGTNLTKIEDNSLVKERLSGMNEEGVTAPEIIPGGSWFNSEPLKISDLRGKVVIVDFWTYTCINCIRTLPYIERWYQTYKDKGLVIIGVHTPEFEFEKNPENVKKAISDFGLTYPIVQDNNYETWNAYANRYWPAKYLIDKNGKIVYTHFGEGNYDETEEIIQKYLKETGAELDMKIDNPAYKIESKTPELYLGYSRMGYFAESAQLKPNVVSDYILPENLAINNFAFGGQWNVMGEYSQAFANSSLILKFEAKDVFLVMRPKGNAPGKIKVYLDDKEVKNITVDTDRLYDLIKLNESSKHTLKIQFLDSNVEVYAFTFG